MKIFNNYNKKVVLVILFELIKNIQNDCPFDIFPVPVHSGIGSKFRNCWHTQDQYVSYTKVSCLFLENCMRKWMLKTNGGDHYTVGSRDNKIRNDFAPPSSWRLVMSRVVHDNAHSSGIIYRLDNFYV